MESRTKFYQSFLITIFFSFALFAHANRSFGAEPQPSLSTAIIAALNSPQREEKLTAIALSSFLRPDAHLSAELTRQVEKETDNTAKFLIAYSLYRLQPNKLNEQRIVEAFPQTSADLSALWDALTKHIQLSLTLPVWEPLEIAVRHQNKKALGVLIKGVNNAKGAQFEIIADSFISALANDTAWVIVAMMGEKEASALALKSAKPLISKERLQHIQTNLGKMSADSRDKVKPLTDIL